MRNDSKKTNDFVPFKQWDSGMEYELVDKAKPTTGRSRTAWNSSTENRRILYFPLSAKSADEPSFSSDKINHFGLFSLN